MANSLKNLSHSTGCSPVGNGAAIGEHLQKAFLPAPNPLRVIPLVPLTVLSSLFFCWASSWRRARQVGPALPPQLNTTPSCITSFESLYAKKQMQLFSHGRAYMRCMIWGEVYLGVEGIVTSWTHRQGRWEARLRSQHLDLFSFLLALFSPGLQQSYSLSTPLIVVIHIVLFVGMSPEGISAAVDIPTNLDKCFQHRIEFEQHLLTNFNIIGWQMVFQK